MTAAARSIAIAMIPMAMPAIAEVPRPELELTTVMAVGVDDEVVPPPPPVEVVLAVDIETMWGFLPEKST
jgi:hypothetical protein